MIKIFTCSIICLISVTFGGSQPTIKGYIIDANDLPIPYVNIGVAERGVGTVSNNKGHFEIDFIKEGDTLRISAIGYESRTISYKELNAYQSLSEELVIKLKSKEYLLDGVEITGRKLKSKLIQVGSKNKKRGHSIGFGSRELGSEIGAKLHFKNSTLVSSANFVINHVKGDSMLFRLKLYDLNEGNIGEQLFKENVLIREKQRKGAFQVDLSGRNLTLEGSYLISLEWVQDMDGMGNEGITFDTKSEGKNGGTYLKFSSVGKFQKVPYLKNRRPCIYILGREYESP